MARMIRKQVYIEPEQEAMLKRRARELGVTESDLIRRGIGETAAPPAAAPLDRKAWEEARELMAKRGKIVAPQTGRGWTREELYEERLERFSRRH